MKYALITGGSRGLGRAVCQRLAADGMAVIINYHTNEAAARETLQVIENQGGTAELLQFDLADKASINAALDRWKAQHPDDFIEVLVNNGGIRKDNLLVFMEDADWDNVLGTTLGGFFHLTRRLIKTMITKRRGRVINMSSLSGLKGLPGQVNYSAAKAGLIGATKALAQEVAPRKITVNAVAPGFIATDMIKDLDEEALKKQIPAGRFGKAEEVADLVAFLASDKAAYITGEVISINGGLYT